jgi:flagellar basal-body rod modification protein FlgD
MSVSAVSGNYLTTDTWTDGATRTPTKTLGQEDFLKLVMAEMTNQDPMNPTSNTETIAQMAQFSSLEQSKAMQKDITALQANSLLGRQVQVKTQDEKGEDVFIEGTVDSIQMEEGTPSLHLDTGGLYTMDTLVSIKPATTTTTTTN